LEEKEETINFGPSRSILLSREDEAKKYEENLGIPLQAKVKKENERVKKTIIFEVKREN
jgi:hypothetical protein